MIGARSYKFEIDLMQEKNPILFLTITTLRKKRGQFLDESPFSTGRGEIFHFIVNTVKLGIYLPHSGMRGIIQKLTPFFFLK